MWKYKKDETSLPLSVLLLFMALGKSFIMLLVLPFTVLLRASVIFWGAVVVMLTFTMNNYPFIFHWYVICLLILALRSFAVIVLLVTSKL